MADEGVCASCQQALRYVNVEYVFDAYIMAVLMATYNNIKKHLVQTLEHVDELNHTDICLLDAAALAETAKLIAILERRTKRLCVAKLDHVKFAATMHEGLLKGQQMMGKDATDASAYHNSILNTQRLLEKHASSKA